MGDPTWRKFFLWPLTNATNYVMTTVGVVVLVQWLSVDERVAPLIAAAAAIPVTFLLSRRLLDSGDKTVPSSRATVPTVGS